LEQNAPAGNLEQKPDHGPRFAANLASPSEVVTREAALHSFLLRSSPE